MIKYKSNYLKYCVHLANKIPFFVKMLRDKKYRVSSTNLSYRQINSLESEGIINNSRDKNSKWRKFSLKELIYLQIIAECRRYGIKNDQITSLKNMFFDETMSDDPKYPCDLFLGETSLLGTITGIRIGLLVFDNGDAVFTDMHNFILLNGTDRKDYSSYLYFNLNEITNRVLNHIGKKKLASDYISLKDFIEISIPSNLTEDEEQLLIVFRQNDYTRITVKKGKGNVKIYGESLQDTSKLTEEELLKTIDRKDYSNISLQKRDGKVVSCKFEDVFKV